MLLHEKLYRYSNGYEKGILGGITDAVGLTDYKGAERARKQAIAVQEKAAGESLQIARENIAFQREQYQQWDNVFGDLSNNIKEYLDKNTANSITAQRIATLNTELTKSEKDLTKSLAQRGINASGLEAQALTSMNYQAAAQRANIRATAEDENMQKKMGFLSLGLGQGSAYAGIVNSASAIGAQSALQGGIATSGAYSNYGNQLYRQSLNTENSVSSFLTGGMKAGAQGGTIGQSFSSLGKFIGL